jgi:hypothetical protein
LDVGAAKIRRKSMNPIGFPEANKTLTKPASMTDEECGPLEIFSGEGQCISCWRPSLRERLSVLFFGRVWLSIFSGETQPPVVVWAASEAFDTAV